MCPLCRENSSVDDVNYVKLGAEPGSEREEEGEEDRCQAELLSGKYASKIFAVVQALYQIQRRDPTAKALVFSSVRTACVYREGGRTYGMCVQGRRT